MANTKRFGFSALSKSNFLDAYNEEILVDKETGEFLVKSPDGQLLSYDYNNRIDHIHNDVKSVMNNLNVYGDLYMFTQSADSKTVPSMLVAGDIFSTEEIEFAVPTTKVIFHINVEPMIRSGNGFVRPIERANTSNIKIASFKCTCTREDGLTDEIIGVDENMTTSKYNTEVFTFSTPITSIKINEISFENLEEYDMVLLNYIGVIAEA